MRLLLLTAALVAVATATPVDTPAPFDLTGFFRRCALAIPLYDKMKSHSADAPKSEAEAEQFMVNAVANDKPGKDPVVDQNAKELQDIFNARSAEDRANVPWIIGASGITSDFADDACGSLLRMRKDKASGKAK